MKKFLDWYGNTVELSFKENAFRESPQHVLVICEYQDGWLLTRHKIRGLEFPGGKREAGESLEEAARREVYEETGAILESLTSLGEYRVTDSKGSFVKAIFRGRVQRLEKTDSYYETGGPAMVKGNLLELRFGGEYSFIMKDQVVEACLERIQGLQE